MTAPPVREVWRVLLGCRLVADPRRAFPDAGKLARLSTQDDANLIRALRSGRWRAFRVRLLWLSLWALAGLVALFVLALSATASVEWVQWVGLGMACVLAYGMEIVALVVPSRSLRRERAVLTNCLLLGDLEQDQSSWHKPNRVDRWMSGLEATASEVEQLTQSLAVGDAAMRRTIADAMRGRAAAIRQLQASFLSAKDGDRDTVIERVAENLDLMIKGYWLDLPGGDLPSPDRSFTRRLSGWVPPVLGVAAITAVVGLVAPAGTTTSVVTAIGGAVIVALLGRIGLSSELVSKGAALVKSDKVE